MDKIKALKQLVGDDVAEEIISTSKSMDSRAKRLGLKYKENGMNLEDEFSAFKAFLAYKSAGQAEQPDDFDEEFFDDEAQEKEAAKPDMTAKMDYKPIEDAVMKAIKAAFAEIRGGMEDEMNEKAEQKALDRTKALKAQNAELLETVKALTARVEALELPIASGAGYRLTDVNPQTTAKELQGAAVNGTIGLLDSLGGIQ